MNFGASSTTLRPRRGNGSTRSFRPPRTEALGAFDRILKFDLDVVAIDGSLHKAPCGGEGTGKSPVARGKLGWKWSVASERAGIPIGWASMTNRNDVKMINPTLDVVEANELLVDIGTLTHDRSCHQPKIRNQLHARYLIELDNQRRGTKPPPGAAHRLTLGLH